MRHRIPDEEVESWLEARGLSDGISQHRDRQAYIDSVRSRMQRDKENKNKRDKRAANSKESKRPVTPKGPAAVKHREEKMAGYRLKNKYGISIHWYNDQMLAQNGVCYICACPPKPNKKLSVDHNHSTGAVRKLLCQSCNIAIGFAKEDTNILRAMIDYIEEHD